MSEYQFEGQLKRGQDGEAVLDRHYGRWFEIKPATDAEQREGVDRHYTDKESGEHFAIEYKTDWTAGWSNNAFVETVSVDTTGKQGWAYTSKADWLIYYIPPLGLAYMFRMAVIRAWVDDWKAKYRTQRIPNKGYQTHGVIVPLHEFEKHSFEVVTIDEAA